MRNEHQASSSSSPRRSKSKTRRPGRSTPRRDRSNLFEIFPLEKRVLLSGTPTTFDHTFRYLVAPALTPAPSPHVTGSATPVGLNAAQIRGAYGVDNISFSNGALGTGAGITIAIIDAYDTPSIIGDLHTFDQTFGLADPPSFQVLNEQGQPGPLPPTDPAAVTSPGDTWEVETSLDVEWVHAMAPQANIILFEANSPTSLFNALDTARNFAGVSVISNSWGRPESAGDTANDARFLVTPIAHQPVTFLFSAGDDGAFGPAAFGLGNQITPDYPASSPNVVSVGGTTLTVTGSNTWGGESGWGNGANSGIDGGGGGGISNLEPQPAYQRGFADPFSTQFRTYPDVAAVADPATGAAVIDTFDFGAGTGWLPGGVGGTSLACPLWAGLIGIANQGRRVSNQPTMDGQTDVLPRLYQLPNQDFHDITFGDNGFAAQVGYDLVTGRGSPIADKLIPDLCGPFIGNQVFNDLNVDGIQNDGGLLNSGGGVVGAIVQLRTLGADGIQGTADDVIVATSTSDSTGGYSFSKMTTGSYYLHFVAPGSFLISPPLQGSDRALDSDPDPTTGNTAPFIVTGDTWDSSIDCGMFEKTITINDVSHIEGNSGLTAFTFTVTIAPVNTTVTSVVFNTSNGTALVSDNDYLPVNGTLTFIPGVLTQTITVQAVGDLKIENDETFNVNISTPPGFLAIKSQGIGTIINDDFPSVTVSDFTATRPDIGVLPYPFVVTLSAPAPFPVIVPINTLDNTAVQGFDFEAVHTTLVYAPGITQQTVDVNVIGSLKPTLDKTFFLAAQASSTATLGNPGRGTGTIISNSPPALGVDDAAVTESLTGNTTLPFVIHVDPTLTGTITVNFTTTDGSAVAGLDYQPVSGTLTFTPGSIVQTVQVPVFRRFISADQGLDKTLTMTLSNVAGTGTLPVLTKPVATGTIHNIATVSLPFDALHRTAYTDYLHNRVGVQLIGPGRGQIVFIGSSSTATDAYEVLLDGTTAGSSLLIRTPAGAQTSLTNVLATGAMRAINARSANLLGQVNVTGSLNSLSLNFVQAGNITVGGGVGNGALAVNLGRALDTSITSAIPISSLTAAAYLNTDNVPDLITAPAIGTIRVKGTFGGTQVVTASVASVIVGGSIQGSSVLANDRIGVVAALNGISDSTFFAGIRTDLTGALPASTDDFVNKSAAIGRVYVRSGGFSNSLVAGWHVGALSLGNVQTVDGGSTFGVSGDRVAAVVGAFTDASPIHAVELDDPTRSLVQSNFVVRSI